MRWDEESIRALLSRYREGVSEEQKDEIKLAIKIIRKDKISEHKILTELMQNDANWKVLITSTPQNPKTPPEWNEQLLISKSQF